MDLHQLKDLAYRHMGNRKAHQEREKGFIYYHGQRVAEIAVTLRNILLPDEDSKDDILTVAAYFHDIAKGIEPHCQYGAVLVREVLKGYCGLQEIEEIAEMIGCHKTKELKEDLVFAKILQDADVLDHFGIMEIWMNFQYSAYTDAPIEESVKFYQQEYQEHVDSIGKYLNFEISKKIYQEKVTFVKQFAKRMGTEATGGIFNLENIDRWTDVSGEGGA